MKCREVERWLVLGAEEPSDPTGGEALREHLESCSRCAALGDELDELRASLARGEGRDAFPPSALVERTRALCLERLLTPEAAPARTVARANGALRRIPPAVWASTIGLLLLTAFLLVPFFGEVARSEPLSYVSWIGLSFIAQNILMLLFSPLLVARWRRA
jgi:hypothetical protein